MAKKASKKVLKPLEYPSKILLAWAEAIGGNEEIRDLLISSQYKELGIFCFALLNDEKSRKWLYERILHQRNQKAVCCRWLG